MTFPHIDEIYNHIRISTEPQNKREIARIFRIKGDDRKILKQYLRQLEADGKIFKSGKNEYSVPGALPTVTLIQITHIDIDGDVFAEPVDWDEAVQGPKPRIELLSNAPMKEGDRALASLKKFSDKLYEGKLIRRIDRERATVLGQLVKTARGYILRPTHKKAKYDFDVSETDMKGAKVNDLVIGEVMPSRGLKNRKVQITEVIGARDDVNAISLIALHEAGLHEHFLEKVIEETVGLKVPPLENKHGKREDLRKIPLVTIDGADARDFDDAVFAEKTGDGGFHLIVAIADVAHYVRPGSALDREAYKRGNSTYFPDRVVPMLPEALSNDLCSLRPKEDRACMAFHLWIDKYGDLKKQKIVRGLMRSQARLIYEQVQAAKDGVVDDTTAPLMKNVIEPLYEAYAILDKARQKRGALDLDLPERQILIDDKGKMIGVKKRARLDAHKLIEEFMILANVAAAQALEAKHAPCVYRIHDQPSADKLDAAHEFVEAFGLSLPRGQVTRPAQINHLLEKAAQSQYSQLISTVILRTQSQAIYHPENIGHFGLALRRYAHFTSPIRRYADLLVHRSLIRAYGLGEGGLTEEEKVTLSEKAEHISQTERTSAEAERAAIDRFTAAWMSERIGVEFSGIISSVTRFGLFVTLDENGADGLIPMRTLPDDYYIHDEKQHALIGRKHKRIYRLGAPVQIRLKEADGLTGSSLFELANDKSADIPGVKFKKIQTYSGKSGEKRETERKNRKPHKTKQQKAKPRKKPSKPRK
ncbi:MAG: ribonuclease R [Alphaproteobacteria bacterium]|nr:ribonuclease R [Alphaproteobacteria bacterium]